MKKILVVEDEQDLAEIVSFNLRREGYGTVVVTDGLSAVETARELRPDLVILDLMLPGLPGMEVLKQLKSDAATGGIPVILATARGEEIDRVVGFEVGADDYVVKPFSMRELLLRVKAILRRAGGAEPAGEKTIGIGPITVDPARCVATVDGVAVSLTNTEFRLLLTLAEGVGRVQSRERLLRQAWGMDYPGDTRTVDTHVTRLRTKLGAAGDLIRTIRGFGYKLEE